MSGAFYLVFEQRIGAKMGLMKHEEALNKILNFQLTNFSHASKHEAKIIKVAEPWQWYDNDRIVCKVWYDFYFDNIEKDATFVRIMFFSIDDFAMYRDFFGELDEAWNKAKEVYDNIPDVIDNKWLKENGFERFQVVVNQIQIVQKGEKMIQFEYKDGQWYEVAGDTQKPVDIDIVIKRVEECNVIPDTCLCFQLL